MNQYTSIGSFAAIRSFALALMLMQVTNAQTMNYNVNLEISGAPNTATYSAGDHFYASITVDLSKLKRSGIESLSVENGLESIQFRFLDNHLYTEIDDPSSGFPKAYFTDGIFTGIDFWNSMGLVGAKDNTFFRFYRDGSFQYSPEGVTEFDGSYSVILATVPEPHTTCFSLLALLCLTFNRQRDRSLKK